MRIEREHDEQLEKLGGYICIRCLCKQSNPYMYETPYLRVAQGYKETFAPYAWPGGYQIVFYSDDGGVFCADCAKGVFITEKIAVNAEIYYEGPGMFCDECNRELEAAYGDPDAPDEEDDDAV